MFQGFDEPEQNWSRLPHALINSLYLITSESELKVVLYILRHTWGYGDNQKKITIDEFCNGRKRNDGSRIDSGLGLSENGVRAGIEKATEHGFIVVAEDATDKARIRRYYQLKGTQSGVQTLNPWGSDFEPHDSTSEPRSEKETIRKKPKKENNIAEKSALLPETKEELLLFEKLAVEFEAKGYRPPKKFPSLACRQKYNEAVTRLNGNSEIAITRALQRGIIAVLGVTDFIYKYQPEGASKNGRTQPTTFNQPHQQTGQTQNQAGNTPGRSSPGHAEHANGQGSGSVGAAVSNALKNIARTGGRTIGPPLPTLPETTNSPNPDIPTTG